MNLLAKEFFTEKELEQYEKICGEIHNAYDDYFDKYGQDIQRIDSEGREIGNIPAWEFWRKLDEQLVPLKHKVRQFELIAEERYTDTVKNDYPKLVADTKEILQGITAEALAVYTRNPYIMADVKRHNEEKQGKRKTEIELHFEYLFGYVELQNVIAAKYYECGNKELLQIILDRLIELYESAPEYRFDYDEVKGISFDSFYNLIIDTGKEDTPPSYLTDTKYLAMYHGKATDMLARMNSRNAKINSITGSATIDNGTLKVVMQKFTDLQAALGVNTHKLLIVGISEFTALNNYSRKGEASLQYMVQFPLEEYAYLLGYDVLQHKTTTPEEAKKEKTRVANTLKEAKKKIKKDLDVLASMELTWEEKVKGKVRNYGDYATMHIIGTRAIRNGYIYMTFDPEMAKYLVLLPITQYHKSLLRVDARNGNAYSMGLKFSEHYNLDNNQKKGTADRLKVETLLNCTSLPSYEDVFKARKSWEERIKEPFEKALDELTAKGVLSDWSYVGTKGAELTYEEATTNKYEEWKDLLVKFELTEAIDHTERLKRREEERKARAKKKSTKKTPKKKTKD